MKGSLWAGSTSTSAGISRCSRAQDSSQSLSGSASGSVGNTETLDEMRGRIWSPEMNRLSSGLQRQRCSGEWPWPPMTCQSRPPMRSDLAGRHPPEGIGHGVHHPAEPPKRLR